MSWRDDAACRDADPDIFYPETPDYQDARAICAQCPVRDRCLTDAMATERGTRYGMFGGLTPRERGSLPWRLCAECGARFPARRNGKGGSVPKFCGDECRAVVQQRRWEAELERQRIAREVA